MDMQYIHAQADQLICGHCGGTAPHEIEEKSFAEGKASHVGAYCGSCRNWIKWLRKAPKINPAWLKKAG